MIKHRSFVEILAALGAGATLLACGGGDATPAPVAPGQEVPAAAASAAPAAGAAAAPTAAAAAAPTVAAAAAPAAATAAAAAAPATAAKKPMPPKIANSKRTADKSTSGCCGQGTCSPC